MEGLPETAQPLPCPLIQGYLERQIDTGRTALGSEARKQLFMLEDRVHFLNHGSYGACLRLAGEVQQWHAQRMEQQPCRFMESELFDRMQVAREEVAELIRADAADVAPVVNATSAVQAVVASVQLQPGDMILITSITYNAVKNLIARRAAAAGAQVLVVELPLQVVQQGRKGMLAAFKAALEAHGSRVKLAVLDHVVSFPPVRLPVADITRMCRAAGAKVLIDGAHAVGALELDVPAIGASFYTANLHKWLCTPKGTAFLWVHPSEQHSMRPPVTSHGQGQGFLAEFMWPGTCDWSGWLAVPAALAVLSHIGFARLRRHNADLLQAGAAILRGACDTEVTLGVEEGLACMAAIPLPALRDFAAEPAEAVQLHLWLRDQYHIEVLQQCDAAMDPTSISSALDAAYKLRKDFPCVPLQLMAVEAMLHLQMGGFQELVDAIAMAQEVVPTHYVLSVQIAAAFWSGDYTESSRLLNQMAATLTMEKTKTMPELLVDTDFPAFTGQQQPAGSSGQSGRGQQPRL